MSAITANAVRTSKSVGELYAFPVASGETIYQGAIVGVNASGLLVNVTSGNAETLKLVGIVMDDGCDPAGPKATTAAGSLLNDRSSEDAGDKTVRLVALGGRFLLDFSVTLAQSNLGDKCFAQNNNDCALVTTNAVALGQIVSVFSTSKAWVELNSGVAKLAE